ncbi:MAG: protein kinase [Gemmatimonadetes bacterium]|nr:protein kinase [Gemmatimonadota bacterium]
MPARRQFIQRSLALACFISLGAATAGAQCPDGSPPPCRSARPITAAARQINPALNPREWIVVPFGNAMRAPELEWLRDASVNLLSLDIGRWTDVHVVPDKRVGDLVRELPASRSAVALTLSDGLAIAKRAGAGMLVMGDFFRIGKGARLVANVFDVKTGNKLRSVVQQATEQDSLLTAFTPLARGVLAVPPPADARIGDLGTSNLDAYQAYLRGVKALQRVNIPVARAELQHALALDSTFALAHMAMANVLGWGEADITGSASLAHALAASRLGAHLPPRERALIEGELGMAQADYPRACAAYLPLVRADSNDISALLGASECSYHDKSVVRDASGVHFTTSWNSVLRLLTRVLELDPSYYVGFEHIFDVLSAPTRQGCMKVTPASVCDSWPGVLMRAGDSIVTTPTLFRSPEYLRQQDSAAIVKPFLVNYAQATRIASNWLAADTSSTLAHLALARALRLVGNLEGARTQLMRVAPTAVPENADLLRTRIDLAIKLGKGAEARALFDSLVKAVPDAPSILTFRGSFDMIFGRLGRVERGIAVSAGAKSPQALAYYSEVPRMMMGIPRPAFPVAELAFAATSDSACSDNCRLLRFAPSWYYGLRTPRSAWPAFPDGAMPDARYALARALARGDTAGARTAVATVETRAHRLLQLGTTENGYSFTVAEGYLSLRDSVAALRAIRFFVDSGIPAMSPVNSNVSIAEPKLVITMAGSVTWPRAMLLRADLASAMGYPAEARTWYARVLDLWADADPELQPTLARVRTALAALPAQ